MRACVWYSINVVCRSCILSWGDGGGGGGMGGLPPLSETSLLLNVLIYIDTYPSQPHGVACIHTH